MSETKFTPGPWNCKGVHPEGCATYIDPGDDPGFGDVAVIYRVLRSDEQVQADARLIAAAPDLYAALELTEGALTALIRDVEAMTDWTNQALGVERKAMFAKILSGARDALEKAAR